jgi:hypothetical protein
MSGIVRFILCSTAIAAASFAQVGPAAAQSGENGQRVPLMMPPEYVPCSEVPQELAEVDARIRAMGRTGRTKEQQFWLNRQERLINRAYTCQDR